MDNATTAAPEPLTPEDLAALRELLAHKREMAAYCSERPQLALAAARYSAQIALLEPLPEIPRWSIAISECLGREEAEAAGLAVHELLAGRTEFALKAAQRSRALSRLHMLCASALSPDAAARLDLDDAGDRQREDRERGGFCR